MVDQLAPAQEAKAKWETLRRHDVSTEQRKTLVAALLADVSGRVGDVAAQHAASRAIQACAKYGTPEQRQQLWQEVKPKAVLLAKTSYGHFLIAKLITTATKEQLPGMQLLVPACVGLHPRAQRVFP